MKPCSKNRKLIAWLALDALDAEAAALREHLARCEGCRRYWEEISIVTERLASAAPAAKDEPSEWFYHRVAAKLQAAESGSILGNMAACFRGTLLGWRLALPAAITAVIALVAFVVPRQPPAVSLPSPPTVQVASPSMPPDLAPTVANYKMVAGQSLEKLDELLTKHGNKTLPPAPVYTASILIPADTSF